MTLLLVLVLVLALVAIIALGLWGATTAATALTLSATIASMQTTITVLSCTLVAFLPLIVFGAMRLGVLLSERKRADDAPIVQLAETPRPPMLDATPAPLQLPAPQQDTAQPFIPARRLVKRSSPRTHHAIRIAKRWFQ